MDGREDCMADEVKDGLVVYNTPEDIKPTPQNSRYLGARRPGRPKSPDSIVESLKQELSKNQNGPKIARNLIKIAQNEKKVTAAVVAAKEIADRLDGKPVQGIAVMQVMDESTAQRLLVLAEKYMGPTK